MAQFRLDGFAIIVGAAGGIGREVALTFAEAGAKGILLADINSEAVAQVADQSKALASNPNYRSISTTVNVTDVASVDALVHLAKEQFGRIDYCVNAFGVDVAEYVPFDETDPDDYDRVLGVTKAAVMDYKSLGIRINQVCPIWVRTPMFEEECRRIPETPYAVEKLSSLKRAIEPDEVASACLYLCSPATVYLNGVTLTMDSELTAGPLFG